MKKIILLLALALGVEVKAQIVGGFIPLNSTKSTTIGAVRTNSLVVTASTISVGAKTLTAGNTGTVAVLSDAVFNVSLGNALTSSPADGSTFYLTAVPQIGATQGVGKLYIPYNCTLVGWTYNGYITVTASSAETSTLSIGVDNSFTNLSTSITFSGAAGVNTYTATGLSQNINAGSYVEGRIVNPTWATNPSATYMNITFWFVRRS